MFHIILWYIVSFCIVICCVVICCIILWLCCIFFFVICYDVFFWTDKPCVRIIFLYLWYIMLSCFELIYVFMPFVICYNYLCYDRLLRVFLYWYMSFCAVLCNFIMPSYMYCCVCIYTCYLLFLYTVLCHFVISRIILCCYILCCDILWYIVSYYIVLIDVILYHFVMSCIILCCFVLHILWYI